MKDCKYIYFQPSKNHEHTWEVYAKKDDVYLGLIEWFTRWNGFIFSPDHETIYEATCLTDIADFIREQNKAKMLRTETVN
jgi:hypothetical protein